MLITRNSGGLSGFDCSRPVILKQAGLKSLLPLLTMLLLSVTPAVAAKARVAIAGPMVGASYSVGIQYQVGVNAALKTLTDGTLLGREIETSSHDDNCHNDIAESVALDIVLDPPAVVIGHSCSGATISAAPVYARHKTLQITPASTNPKVTEMGIPTLFRMIGRDDLQGQLAAQRIARLYPDKRIATGAAQGDYSTWLAKSALESLKSLGITPILTLKSEAEAASYIADIQQLLDARIEVLYFVGGALDTALFMRQARQMGATFQVISSDTLVSDVFKQAAGDAADNIPFTFPPEAAQLKTSAPAIAAIKELGQSPTGYTLLAYAATEAWIIGVQRAGTFAADQVAAALREAPLTTILGEISFDAKGDIITPYPPFVWYAWQGEQRVRLD